MMAAAMLHVNRPSLPPIWRNHEFRKIWAGSLVSWLGSSITRLAIPLIAIQSLHAGAADMGRLGAAGTAAFILIGLLAGVIVDRFHRRLILVITSCASACVIAVIPLAATAGALRMEQLYFVAFATGCLDVVDEVAFQSILPRLVGRDQIMSGNSAIRSTAAVTDAVGPGFAGVVIQMLTAPLAVVLDAASFVVAAGLLLFVRIHESTAVRDPARRVWTDIVEGLRFVLGAPALRAIAIGGGMHNVFSNGAMMALYVLYMSRVASLTPFQIGMVLAAGGPGAVIGSAVASRYARRFGMRSTLAQTQFLTGVARAFVPLAALVPFPLIVLASGELVLGFARGVFNVNQVSLRQAMTPDHLQGRMSASMRFLLWSLVPFGALLGGLAAERFGLVATMAVAAAGTTLSSLWFLLVPADAAVA